MAKSKGAKVYAVARGRAPGIYASWDECKAQTSGFKGAVFKSFKTRSEAQSFIQLNGSSSKPPVWASASTASASSKPAGEKRGRKRSSCGDGALAPQLQRQQLSSSAPNYRFRITIHFDGGSRGNPGLAGAGAKVVLFDAAATPMATTYLVREYCGSQQTNNYAEYTGLLAGLTQAKMCLEQCTSLKQQQSVAAPSAPLFRLQILGDSKLIVQQLRGTYQCWHPNLEPLFRRSQELIADMRGLCARSEVSYDHVYRENNKIADALANEAMDQRRTWTTSTADGADDGRKSAVALRDERKVEVDARIARRRMKSAVALARKGDDGKFATAVATRKKNDCAAPTASEREVIDVDDDSNSDSGSHLSC